MKTRTLVAAGIAAFVWQAPALAQESVDDRLSGLERRIKYLEQRVAAQDEMIVEKDRQIAELTEGREDAWFDAVEIGGVIELEAAYASHVADENPYEGDPSTTAELATVELGIAARIHDWVGAEIVVKKNDDDDDIAIDEAFLTIAPPEGAWSLQTGRYVVPFGVYETNMISDPVTLDLGETGQDAVMLAAESGGVYGSVFAFNGDLDRGEDDTIDGFGVTLGYAMEIEGGAIDATSPGSTISLSWINDLGESDGFDGVIDPTGVDNVPGWAASVVLGWGDVTLIGEYLTALDGFEGDGIEFGGAGAEPSAWTVEAAYGFDLGGRDATAAASYQGTSEASELELPENRSLVGLSVEMAEGVALSAEWKRDEDYGEAEGGTGKNADTVTVQLAAEF